MALYKVISPRLRMSAHRLATGTGGVAGPDAADSDKAQKDGAPEKLRFPLGRNQLVYTEKGDLQGLNDDAKKRAFYAHNAEEVEHFIALNALEEVGDDEKANYGTAGDPRYEGLVGQDDGTDLDVAHGEELRQAAKAQAADNVENTEKEADAGKTGAKATAQSGGRAKPKPQE